MSVTVGAAESRALWDAVDLITKATKRKADRDFDNAEWLWQLANDPTLTYCDVEAYRAATLAYGEIPALWDQAEWALTTGSEMTEGGGSSLRERSPADLDLMETMLTIRETIWTQLEGRSIPPKDGAKARVRQLASHLVTNGPVEHVEWWTFRFAQWSRLLLTHLNALDHVAKNVYLRNTACPACQTRQVTRLDPATGERRVTPAILIDFADDLIRAAQCQQCGHAWFRGDELERLAQIINPESLSA